MNMINTLEVRKVHHHIVIYIEDKPPVLTMSVDGCHHYRRHCELKAPCCNTFYVCRKCHDDAKGNHHLIDRFAVREMRCLYCHTEQAISNQCVVCEKQMAHYYCDICHLFDDDRDKVFWHCVSCGFCRFVRGTEQHEHCEQCHSCMPLGHDTHVNMDTNCPICLESLSHGPDTITQPGPCDHLLHEKCYLEYISQGHYSCPLCARTFATCDMTQRWSLYDHEIATQPMPDEYRDIPVSFKCNDCRTIEKTTLNLIGYKCSVCRGYNTLTV